MKSKLTKLQKLKLALWWEFSYWRFRREYKDTFKAMGSGIWMALLGIGSLIVVAYAVLRLFIIPIFLLIGPFFFIGKPDRCFENVIKARDKIRKSKMKQGDVFDPL